MNELVFQPPNMFFLLISSQDSKVSLRINEVDVYIEKKGKASKQQRNIKKIPISLMIFQCRRLAPPPPQSRSQPRPPPRPPGPPRPLPPRILTWMASPTSRHLSVGVRWPGGGGGRRRSTSGRTGRCLGCKEKRKEKKETRCCQVH